MSRRFITLTASGGGLEARVPIPCSCFLFPAWGPRLSVGCVSAFTSFSPPWSLDSEAGRLCTAVTFLKTGQTLIFNLRLVLWGAFPLGPPLVLNLKLVSNNPSPIPFSASLTSAQPFRPASVLEKGLCERACTPPSRPVSTVPET